MTNDINADNELKLARLNYWTADIISATGCFLIIYQVGTIISGDKPNLVLGGIGSGLIIASVPFKKSYNKHARSAINLYNSNIQVNLSSNKTKLSLFYTINGLELTISF